MEGKRDRRIGSLLASVLAALAGVLSWVAFILWYNAGGWLAPWSILVEAVACAAAGVLIFLAGVQYRRISGSRRGFAFGAAALLAMAACTFPKTGVVAVAVLTTAAIAAAVAAVRGLEQPKAVPGDSRDGAVGADSQPRPPIDKVALKLWGTAGALLFAAMGIAAIAAGTPLYGAISVSENLRSEFNLLGVIFTPIVAVLVLTHGAICWFAASRVERRVPRVTLIVIVTAIFESLPLVIGLQSVGPVMVMLYNLPLVVTAVYVLVARRPALMRTLGVAAVGAATGFFLYVLGWALVGAETD